MSIHRLLRKTDVSQSVPNKCVKVLFICLKQKKRGKGGDGGRNKENVIEDIQSDGEEQTEPSLPEKKTCYEVKHSDVMGR